MIDNWTPSRTMFLSSNTVVSRVRVAIIWALLIFAIPVAMARESLTSGWTQYKGKGYTLCDGLLKDLRRYKYPDPLMNSNSCSLAVVANYSGFTEPPWEDLDVKQHEDLLFQLQRFTAIGPKNYFAGVTDKTDQGATPPAEGESREQVRDFISRGGKIRIWRTPLFKRFDILDQNPKTKGQLNTLQLRTPIGDPKNHGLDQCPDVPKLEWADYIMLVNDRLTGPDPRLDPQVDSRGLKYFNYSNLLIFKGTLHRLDGYGPTISIYRHDIPADDGSGEFCRLVYRHPNPGRK